MEAVKAIALSVILAISGWFNDGLKDLEAKKYDEAIAGFTKVYEKDVPGNAFRELALFFRGQAYFEKGDKEKACADMLALIRMQPAKELAQEGKALYLKWGGAPEKLLPAVSPKAVWANFLEAARKGDQKLVLKMSSGMFRELIRKEAGNDPEQLKALPEELTFVPVEEKIGEKEEEGKAELLFQVPDTEVKFKMFLVQDVKSNVWLIDSLDERVVDGEIDISVKGASQSNLARLKLIGQALKIYAADYSDLFPATLDVLKEGGYLENENAVFWKNPEDNEQVPFVYCPGLKQTDDVDKIIVASPLAVDGWRDVLFVDEHAEKMDEDKFKEAVAKQGWKFKGLVKKEDISEEKQNELRDTVRKLADTDSNVRIAAKKKLLEMGLDAFPILNEFINDPDPEIRIEVKNILKGKQPNE